MTTLDYSLSRYQQSTFLAGRPACRVRLGVRGYYVVTPANGTTITYARRLAAAHTPFFTGSAQSGHTLDQTLPL